MDDKKTIVFVYNADSGLFNALTDTAHKLLSPKTYSCNLCALTYGNFSMRTEWKEFLENLNTTMEFLHKNEFNQQYPSVNAELPAIFLQTNGQLTEIINANDINQCQNLAELKALIQTKVFN